MKKTNPLHAQIQPLQGQQLPDNWREQAQNIGGNYDRRDLPNLWKQAKMTKISPENIAQNARLSRPSWSDMFGAK